MAETATVGAYAALNARAARSYQRRRRRNRLMQIGLGAGVPLALLLLWQAGSMFGLIDERFFPAPSTIVERAGTDITERNLLGDLGVQLQASLIRIVVGIVLGVSTGILVGTLMGSVTAVRHALSPLVYALYPMPKLAILPLLLIIFGIGDTSKIMLVTLGVFFVVCLSAFSGTLYTSQVYADVAKAFAFPRMMRYWRVVLPAALPSIMNGVKLGIGQALILVVSVEFVSSNDGIGYFIWQSWQTLDIPRMFIGLICVALGGAGAVLLGDLCERMLVPWAKR
ncbi:ABC transporter permease [Micromonospora sp. WMMD1082]|uniref:ABC transporter permease n=1 Tax=Micromonospora sp. WMMD1082 TaxID=3016104 RepID=UPI0024164438|nr:ABC transporter permease [Micromonospora sp. WMMD1082]MDG4798341.1 ABC transporter permease [Micromonospora sp. WMMD1082]